MSYLDTPRLHFTGRFQADVSAKGARLPASIRVLGGTLSANERSAPAKLVDLDPEQQMVSMIFGMSLTLRMPDGSEIVSGGFVPAPFENIWVRFPAGQPDSFFSATYQSIISDLTWSDGVDSPVIAALRAAATGDALSIRFTVDGIDQEYTSPLFTWGRIVRHDRSVQDR